MTHESRKCQWVLEFLTVRVKKVLTCIHVCVKSVGVQRTDSASKAKQEETVPVQAHVPKSVHKRAKLALVKRDKTFNGTINEHLAQVAASEK